ncbi:MAG: trypsin-like serine protease with C-terminal domain [Bacteroidetes bacterium]|jgi:S1-C subfamily serine protease|nr:trypsin-like serine protease with C-terminal domain [Bacteroidota bacterium]
MRNVDLFDNYIADRLNAEEKTNFEIQLNSDEVFAKAFREHKELLEALNAYHESAELKAKLNAIHAKEFGNDAKVISIDKKEKVKHLGRTALVAASTAFIVVMGAITLVGTDNTKINKAMTELSIHQDKINQAIVEGIKEGSQKPVYVPANIEGSAFALNNDGYILTSYHIVNGSDSVFVQNNTMERTVAKVVLTDPKLDLAVLKIENKEITKNWQVPFSFNEKATDIGEKVFTLGYPRKDMVYGEGALSSLSGFSNDTSMYQISIPVNPGNSGGPLLDEQGNVIGVIRGKITNAEATGFAIKSREIVKSLSVLSNDSIKTGSSRKPVLKGIKRTEQIKRINPYVFNVLVY